MLDKIEGLKMEKYDIIIVGAGPAGLTSALYGARANKKVLVLDGAFGSGECGKIIRLDNYPGISQTDGITYLFTLKDQAEKSGATFLHQTVTEVDCATKTVKTRKGEYCADVIILATGCKSQKLGLENEKQLVGYGVSYCATCDGALFRGREVALVGSGKKAEEDVKYLASIVKKVYFITNSSALEMDNVEKINSSIVSLNGNPLHSITLDNGAVLNVPVIFVNIGYIPETALVLGQVEMNGKGYIITDENMQTSVSKVYAVGDIRQKSLRQIITACSDGAIACEHAIRNKE